MQEVRASDSAHEATGFTCRFTAGLRFVESTCVPNPLLPSDPLAGALAGDRGLELAKQELEQLSLDQGPGKHLRVPARSRLVDDLLQLEIQVLLRQRAGEPAPGCDCGSGSGSGSGSIGNAPSGSRAEVTAPSAVACQVVSLGAGMCTRPWRLACLAPCRVIELDLPHIVQTKGALLAAVGAQVVKPAAGAPPPPLPPAPQQPQQQQEEQQTMSFPLLATSYACVGADLSFSNNGGQSDGCAAREGLAAALTGAGFDSAVPTIWVAEALLYYMPLVAASELLSQLAAVSAPGSRLILTCIDRELLEASLRGVPKGHVFADLWHFEAEALLYDTPAFRDAWQVDWTGQPPEQEREAGSADPDVPRRLPASTRRLAAERLGADTYVALYGGSELLFAAGLRQQRERH